MACFWVFLISIRCWKHFIQINEEFQKQVHLFYPNWFKKRSKAENDLPGLHIWPFLWWWSSIIMSILCPGIYVMCMNSIPSEMGCLKLSSSSIFMSNTLSGASLMRGGICWHPFLYISVWKRTTTEDRKARLFPLGGTLCKTLRELQDDKDFSLPLQ